MNWLGPVLYFFAVLLTAVVFLVAAWKGPEWDLHEGSGYKLLVIALFAAATAAQLIWGGRRER